MGVSISKLPDLNVFAYPNTLIGGIIAFLDKKDIVKHVTHDCVECHICHDVNLWSLRESSILGNV